MAIEDRVVTTATVRDVADDQAGMLAIAAGVLSRLRDEGLHILVPGGPAPVPGEVLMCETHLDTGQHAPTRVPVLVPRTVRRQLPTAFAVVAAATRLVPTLVQDAVADEYGRLVLDDVDDEPDADEAEDLTDGGTQP
jgi:hypothetical protein